MSAWGIFERVEIVGIADLSFDGVVLRCNREFARLQGDEPVSCLGENLISMTAPDDRERIRVSLARLASSEVDSVQHEKRYVTRGGHEVPCRGQFIAVRDSEPYVTAFIYIYESQSERINKLESLIAEIFGTLQHDVNVNVTGQDNSNNAHADNQSQASISNNWNQPPRQSSGPPWGLIGAMLAAAALAAALAAMWLGRYE